MKNKFKLTDTYLSSLPGQLSDGIEKEIQTAEVEPYVLRKGFAGLEIDEDEERVSIARMSTRDIDSDSEIVMPYSLDVERYQANPVVLLNHAWGEPPIGSAEQVRLHDRGIDGKIRYADTPRGDEIWSLVRDRHMRANSIGFVILDYVSRNHPDFGKLVDTATAEWDEFTSQLADRLVGFVRRGILLENSVVTIPANAAALMEAVSTRSMSLSPEMIDLLHLDVPEDVPDGEQAEADEAHPETETVEIDVAREPETVEIELAPEPGQPAAVEQPEPQTASIEPRLVARLVRRASKTVRKAADPAVVARAARDAADLKLGKI